MADENDDSKLRVSNATSKLEASLPISEHVEVVSEGGKRVRRRGVYLLPNLFTMGALFAGFYSIVAAMAGDFDNAGIAIFVAGCLDGLDGRVARLTNTQSEFGAQLDSLSDMVCFGVAPGLVVFAWGLGPLERVGWACTFIYIAAAALRLARFNVQMETADKRFFSGLASPTAAGIVASMVWLAYDRGLYGDAISFEISLLAGLVTATVGFLMVVNIPYYSFKGLDAGRRVPYLMVLLVVLLFALISIDPPLFILLIAATYGVSGPVQRVWRGWRRSRRAS